MDMFITLLEALPSFEYFTYMVGSIAFLGVVFLINKIIRG